MTIPRVSITGILAVIGLFLAATPFEISAELAGFATTLRLLALLLVVPFLYRSGDALLSKSSFLFALFISIVYAISNISAPGTWSMVVVLGIIFVMLIGSLIARDAQFKTIVDRVIALHVAGLFVQFLSYYAFNVTIDPYEFIFPFSSSRTGFNLEIFRMGGFSIEPGTYSTYVFLLLVLRLCLGGRLQDRISLVAAVSVGATVSAWGLTAVLVYYSALTLSFLRSSQKFVKFAILFLVLIILPLWIAFSMGYLDALSKYYATRFDPTQGSGSTRAETFRALIDSLDMFSIIGIPETQKFCAGCSSPQDLGLWSQLIVRLGLPTAFIIMLACFISSSRKSLALALLVLFSFTGKQTMSDPITLLLISVMVTQLFSSKPISTA